MNQEIFLLRSDEQLEPLRESGYVSEERLQHLLERHPQLIPGEQVSPDEPRRWLLVSREMGVPGERDGGNRWSIDHLFLDQDGVPTLVEVKRSSDARIRREVVGQMLDYAANGLVYWPPDEIRRVFEQGCQERQLDPEQEVEGLTGAEESYEGFWERVKTNLKAGRIRLLFVADRIPAELLRIVEFLNEQMTLAEVLAVEIRQFAGADAITLVPRVLGRTAAAEQTKGKGPREKRQWDEASFFAALQKTCSPAEVTVARDILQWARGVTQEISWGQGVQQGSFVPTVEHAGSRQKLFAAWTGGTIELYFYWHASRAPFSDRDKRLEMRKMLQEIPGIEFAESAVDRRPSFPMAALVDPSALDRFKAVFEWFIAEVQASESSQTAEQVD